MNDSYLAPSIIARVPLSFPVVSCALGTICVYLCVTERLMNAGTGKRAPLRPAEHRQQFVRDESDEENDTGSTSPTVPSSCSQSSAISRAMCSGLVNTRVDLEMKSLWEEFHALGTEMIVTKAGR